MLDPSSRTAAATGFESYQAHSSLMKRQHLGPPVRGARRMGIFNR